jgi:hypothetical protein
MGHLQGAPVSDELRPLPPEIAALLSDERNALPPSAEARSRVRGRLQATLGAAVIGAAATAGSVATPAAAATLATTGKLTAVAGKPLALALAVKITIAVCGAGAVGATAYLARRSLAPRAVAPTAVVPAAVAPAAPSVPLPPPSPLPLPSTSSPSPLTSPSTSTSTSTSTISQPVAHGSLKEERALLGRAQAALGDDDAAGAMAAVERHARRFPDGQLAEERDSLRVRALAAAGDRDEARRRAGEFARRYPRSLFLPSVRAAGDGTE